MRVARGAHWEPPVELRDPDGRYVAAAAARYRGQVRLWEVWNEPDIDFDSDSVWDYLAVTVGAFGYSGRNADIVNGLAEHFNDYYRLGAGLDVLYRKFRLKGELVNGRDTNPYYASVKNEIKSVVVSSSAEYMFDTNVIAAFRHEYLYDQTHLNARNNYIPSIAYAPLQNVRVALEYRYEDYLKSGQDDNKIANMAVSFSF